jgi:hypothetical protein
MIHVADGADVDVGLGAVKFLFGHVDLLVEKKVLMIGCC